MPQDPVAAANRVADQLHERGHPSHADYIRSTLLEPVGLGLLVALREACQTVLTAVEAIDPVSATLVEELRLEVDKRIKDHR